RRVVDDAAEVVAVGEHLTLRRQKRPAALHQVHAGEAVVARDLLGAQVLLDCDRIVGAALDGGVVGDDDAFAARDAADAGQHPGAGDLPAVHAMRGELRELQERAAGVEQHADTLARGELAGRLVLVGSGLRAAARRPARRAPQILDQGAHGALVVLELLGVHVDPGADAGHGYLPRLPVCPTII